MAKTTNKIPLALRLIPWLFPKVEAVAPPLANRFFIHLFFTPLKYGIPEKEKEVAARAQQSTVMIDGRRIHFYTWGPSHLPVVLLVHGWAGRATQFRKFIDPLIQAGFQVVAFDGPAHGQSEGKKTNLDDFNSVIQYACAHHAVVGIITHSFGGAATLYALTKGLPVRTLVNIGSPTQGDEIIKTYLRTIGGSEKTGQHFRDYVMKKTGKSFDDFTAMRFIEQVPADLNLLLIHDVDDAEAVIGQARALVSKFPAAHLYETAGLGHTRILKDDTVIAEAVTFIRRNTSGI